MARIVVLLQQLLRTILQKTNIGVPHSSKEMIYERGWSNFSQSRRWSHLDGAKKEAPLE